MQSGVKSKQFTIKAEAGVYPKAEAGGHKSSMGFVLDPRGVNLKAHKRACGHDIVHWTNNLNISIEIEATVFVKDLETRVVAYKRVFLGLVSLAGIWNAVDIEVIFVPFLDFIVWEKFLPAIDTFKRRFG